MLEKTGAGDRVVRSAGGGHPRLSLVVPAFCEEANIDKLYEELARALEPLELDWQVLLVDDGSSDGTWSAIERLHRADPRVQGLRLSRNFGHQYALFAGLCHAAGDAVITMDGDLQHPPSVIPDLLREWRNGARIVHTMRIDPPDVPWLKRATSKLFYKVFSGLSGVRLSEGAADFRLLDRAVLAELIQFRESGLFLRGIVQWLGYPTATVKFECGARYAGKSHYSWGRMLRFAWTGITSFSIIPLRLGIAAGLLTSLFAFYQLGYAVYIRVVLDDTVPGWASVIGLTSLLFGVLFMMLGILGEYLARVLEEVRGRPRFLISDTVGLEQVTGAASRPRSRSEESA